MNFLDVNVYKGKRFENNATLELKTYFKPTNAFMYLHRESCNSRHVFTGFIKGEAIRHIRNTNDKNELQTIISSFKLNLIKRGYNEIEIDDNINQALSNNRAEFLNKKSKMHTKEIPLVLSTKYSTCIRKIKQCLVKHWQLLKHNEICRDIFTKEPIIAYIMHRNLGEHIDLLENKKNKKVCELGKGRSLTMACIIKTPKH
jgi:hypothetical protein